MAAVSLVMTSLWSGPTAAGQEFQTVSPDELRMISEPLAPGAPAIILQRRVDRDDNGRSQEDDYFRIKILTEEGRKYADVQIPFYEGIADIRNIRARTIRTNGFTADFDGKVYENYIVKRRGVKLRAKTFTLPDVQVGSVVEYSYTVDLKGYLYDSHWVLNRELFTKHAQFSLKPLRSTYTPMSLRWTLKDVPSDAQPTEGPDHVIRMEVSNIPAFEAEDLMPPENELKSRVDFTYLENFGEPDPDKFWKRIGKQGNDGLDIFLGKRKAMEEAVSKIVSPNDPPEAKLRKIYARVQGLRNISYEVEKTEKEEKRNKEKPAKTVADVWKHGYGNAVELPWLFLGLARAAGFEAYGCWVADRSEYFFNPKLMESEGLRNNIVLVKVNGEDIYLDPGAPFAPFGLLPWTETATPGIRMDNEGGTWIRTPLPDSAESQLRRTANFKLSEAGDLEGTLTLTFTGLEATHRRMELRNDDDVERKKFLEELVKAQIPVTAEVELTKKPDWSGSEIPLIAEFAVKIPNWASHTGRRVFVPVGVFAGSEKHVFERSDRVHPVYFDYPYGRLDEVTIELPPQWKAIGVPGPRMQKGDRTAYRMKVEDNQTTLHVTRQFNIDILMLEKKYYSILRNFFQMVRSSDEEQIVLQSTLPAQAIDRQ